MEALEVRAPGGLPLDPGVWVGEEGLDTLPTADSFFLLRVYVCVIQSVAAVSYL